jgi:hypothetical protein
MVIAEILIVAGVLAAAGAYGAVWVIKNFSTRAAQLTTNAGIRAGEFINTIDLRYEDVVEQRIEAHGIAPETAIDTESWIEDLFVMMKPDIDALLAHINATDDTAVKVQYTSRFFNNAVGLSDAFFAWRSRHPEQMLSGEQEQKMYTAFKDAMRADLRQRLLALSSSQQQGQLPASNAAKE